MKVFLNLTGTTLSLEQDETRNEKLQEQPGDPPTIPAAKDPEVTASQSPGAESHHVAETLSSISPTQTDTMEVHKHPHHITHKKKWPEYFLEFFMIFFAVFLGFLAENWREDAVESKKERQYVSSLFADIKDDTARIHFHIRTRTSKAEMMDSLADLLLSAKDSEAENEMNYLARFVTRSFPFISENGTLQELKNSDGLRLIRKKGVADSLLRYDGAVRYIQYVDETEMFPVEKTFREMAGEVFDSRTFNFKYADLPKRTSGNKHLLTSDPVIINKLALQVRFEARTLERSVQNFHGLERNATRLMELLRREYKLSQ